MLSHFRKYQKSLYIIVSFVVIISFVFIGTFNPTGRNEPVYQDKKIGQLINGSALNERDLKLFSQFISSSKHTASFERSFVNVLNDGVFTEDFLKTKLAHMLVNKYSEKLKPALTERLEKIRRYVPYEHPEAPFLSAKTMWQHFSPGLYEKIEKITSKTEADQEFFSLLVDIYLGQLEFPAEYLRRVLVNHQSQYTWLKPDPRLREDSFALFGFNSLKDWFSDDMMDLVSQFVMNAAIYSEEKGYRVSNQEAKESMLYTVASLKTKENIEYKTVLQFLGLQEKQATSIWKKVLLFRRLFNHLSTSMLLDSSSVDAFSSYALEKASVDFYEMQPSLVFSSFAELLKFQLYVENISSQDKKELSLPQKILDPSGVKAKELIKNTYSVELATIDLLKKSQSISIRQMEAWQIADNNWNSLVEKFVDLSNSSSPDSRYKQLSKLDSKKRSEIDLYSRQQMIKATLGDKATLFTDAKKEKKEIEVFSNKQTNLAGIEDADRFIKFLEKTASSGIYEEENTLYSFNILSKEKSILSFSEALNNGALTRMLDDTLEKEYEKLKASATQNFKNEKGEYKPLYEVKDLLGVYHFSYLLKAIDKECNTSTWIAGMGPKEFYTKNRFSKHMKQAREKIVNNDHTDLLSDKAVTLLDQWKIVRQEKEIKKAEKTALTDQIFSAKLDELSNVYPDDQSVCFFKLNEKSIDQEAKKRQRQKALDAITLSMKQELAEKMLKKMEEKSALTF